MLAWVASMAASIGKGAPAAAMATRGLGAFWAKAIMLFGAMATASERKDWGTEQLSFRFGNGRGNPLPMAHSTLPGPVNKKDGGNPALLAS